MINAVNSNNNTSFKGIKLYFISSRSKQRTMILEAAKTPAIASKIKSLEKHNLGFDIVRDYDHDSRPTSFVNLRLDYKDAYTPKDQLNPIQGVRGDIKTLEDAKKLFEKGIKKAKAYLPKHLKLLKKQKKYN